MNLKTLTLTSTLVVCLAAGGAARAPAAFAVPNVHNDPDTFDAYKPGAYLNGKTFHVPAGASFAWQAWENPQQQVGAILVNNQLEQALIKVEHIELARPSDDADSLVLSQYTLTVNTDVSADTILEIKTGGGTQTADDPNWSFGFVLHIVRADKYMTLIKKLSVT